MAVRAANPIFSEPLQEQGQESAAIGRRFLVARADQRVTDGLVVSEEAREAVATERQRIADDHEREEPEPEDHEVRRHHVRRVLRTTKARLDEGEAGLHEDDQHRADHDPEQVEADLAVGELVGRGASAVDGAGGCRARRQPECGCSDARQCRDGVKQSFAYHSAFRLNLYLFCRSAPTYKLLFQRLLRWRATIAELSANKHPLSYPLILWIPNTAADSSPMVAIARLLAPCSKPSALLVKTSPNR